jgi:hypothetical protein
MAAGRLLLLSGLRLLAVVAPLGGLVALVLIFSSREPGDTTWILVGLSVSAAAWSGVRYCWRPTYGVLARCLHWIALEPKVVRLLSFDLERHFLKRRSSSVDPVAGREREQGAVYVCGLPRSGTTIVLRILEQVGSFQSLRYSDMPFVLAPNLWGHLRRGNARTMPLVERPHGDGLLVDYDSPEAFEEVYWRTFNGTHVDGSGVSAPEPAAVDLERFAAYRKAVCLLDRGGSSGGQMRYLSKNNYNLLRLPALLSEAGSSAVVVYREPVATACSLHRVHTAISQMQLVDSFGRRYMRWLGHHEFGLDHKPFAFAVPGLLALQPSDPNYWLEYWHAVHTRLLDLPDLSIAWVEHGRLVERPQDVVASLLARLGLDHSRDVQSIAAQVRPSATKVARANLDPALVERCGEVFACLRNRAEGRL